jgi:hypothetical protein
MILGDNILKSVLVVLSVFLVSACAILKVSYQEPASGPTASIVFVNNGAGDGSAELFKEHETCKGREFSPLIRSGDSLELKVAANRPLSFSLGYSVRWNAYCRVYATFKPNEGSKYVAKVANANGGCSLSVSVLTLDDGSLAVEGVNFRKQTRTQLYEGSSFCQ